MAIRRGVATVTTLPASAASLCSAVACGLCTHTALVTTALLSSANMHERLIATFSFSPAHPTSAETPRRKSDAESRTATLLTALPFGGVVRAWHKPRRTCHLLQRNERVRHILREQHEQKAALGAQRGELAARGCMHAVVAARGL